LQREGRKADAGTAAVSNNNQAVYFCPICYRGFGSSSELEEHKKSHRELEVDETSCKMLAQPAGVV